MAETIRTGKASRKELNTLHGVIADYYNGYLLDAIEEGEEISAGTLSAINKFLKDNEVTADMADLKVMDSISSKLSKLKRA